MAFWKRQAQSSKESQAVAGAFRISAAARTSIDPDGIAFFHLTSGVIYRANRIGARIWQGVVENQGVETIAARISDEYGAPRRQVERDTVAFLLELKAHEFLTDARGD